MEYLMLKLVECTVTMTAVGLLYMAIRPLLEARFSAKGRYYGWLVIMAGFIIPLRFHPFGPTVRITELLPALQVQSADAHLTIPGTAAAVWPGLSWYEAAGGLWIGGTAVFLLIHAVRHKRLLNMVKRWSRANVEPELLRTLQRLQAEMGIKRKVALMVCAGIPSPMLLGIVRPVILLPSDPIPDHELALILRHELAHLKRHDLLSKAVVFMACALHWFNPIVYRMAREIELECEIACDEEVVKGAGMSVRVQYVEAIINMVRRQSCSRPAVLFSTSFYDSRLGLKGRVHAVMDARDKRRGVAIWAVTTAAILLAGAAVNVGAAGNELVSQPKAAIAEAEQEAADRPVHPKLTYTDASSLKDGAHQEGGMQNSSIQENEPRLVPEPVN